MWNVDVYQVCVWNKCVCSSERGVRHAWAKATRLLDAERAGANRCVRIRTLRTLVECMG